MSSVKNAPSVPNTGGYETRVSPPLREVLLHATFNSGSKANLFEQRAVQESGTH